MTFAADYTPRPLASPAIVGGRHDGPTHATSFGPGGVNAFQRVPLCPWLAILGGVLPSSLDRFPCVYLAPAARRIYP